MAKKKVKPAKNKAPIIQPNSVKQETVKKPIRLDASVPANNQKIIELYNKIKKDELDVSPAFQRKLVWRKQHKIKFIETILKNYPFPEVYIAPDPAGLDLSALILKDLIVDGQQRLTTIVSYIEATEIFGTEEKLPIPRFAELGREAKTEFLNYEVSVRYLKNADEEQIKEVFQRINSTEYSLNNIERTNARWGNSEFVYFAKQIVERDIEIDKKVVAYRISEESRLAFINFFIDKHNIFSESDFTRMLALQYMMTLLATLCEKNYFDRNSKVLYYTELYFDEFLNAGEIEHDLLLTIKFIDSLNLGKNSYWFNKANLFTLICEIFNFDKGSINKELFREKLLLFETYNKAYDLSEDLRDTKQMSLFSSVEYTLNQKSVQNLRNQLAHSVSHIWNSHTDSINLFKYFAYAREGVNNKASRDFRGQVINSLITDSLTVN